MIIIITFTNKIYYLSNQNADSKEFLLVLKLKKYISLRGESIIFHLFHLHSLYLVDTDVIIILIT